MSEKTYYIRPKYDKYPQLIVRSGEKFINLKGEATSFTTRGTKQNPSKEVEVLAANEAILQELYENPDKYGNFTKLIGKVGEVQDNTSNLASLAALLEESGIKLPTTDKEEDLDPDEAAILGK